MAEYTIKAKQIYRNVKKKYCLIKITTQNSQFGVYRILQ